MALNGKTWPLKSRLGYILKGLRDMLRPEVSPLHLDQPWKVFKQESDTFKFVFQIPSDSDEAWWGIWDAGWADEGLNYSLTVRMERRALHRKNPQEFWTDWMEKWEESRIMPRFLNWINKWKMTISQVRACRRRTHQRGNMAEMPVGC